MRIGEVAKMTGVSSKTLRFYEEIGVLSSPGRTPEGYRNYSKVAVDQINFIKASQAVGLSLREIRDIMVYRQREVVPCQHVLELLQQRSREYQDKIDELTKARSLIDLLVNRARDLDVKDCQPGDICHIIPQHELSSPDQEE